MNSARFERFSDLAKLDFGPEASGHPSISIARGSIATAMPYRLDMLERHPDIVQAVVVPACWDRSTTLLRSTEMADCHETPLRGFPRNRNCVAIACETSSKTNSRGIAAPNRSACIERRTIRHGD